MEKEETMRKNKCICQWSEAKLKMWKEKIERRKRSRVLKKYWRESRI